MPADLQKQWGKTCIPAVKACPVVTALLMWPEKFMDRDMIWFIDNSICLGATVKGGSGSADVDRSTALVYLLCAHLRVRIWFDYMELKANWSDGGPRLLGLDPFAATHYPRCSKCMHRSGHESKMLISW